MSQLPTVSRRTLLTATALSAAGVLAGCASSASSTASTSWSIPKKDPHAKIHVLGIDAEADIKPVFEAFAKAHPTIQTTYEYVPLANLDTVLQTRITSKTGDPDVYWANMPDIPAQVSRGYAMELTQQFKGATSNFYKSALDATTVNGKLYALPIADSTQLVFYNKTLLSKAGVSFPSSDPTKRSTWEDLTAGAKKAQAAGAKYGLILEQQNYYQYQPLPMELGGGTGATGPGNLTPDITSAPWVKAMTWLGDIFSSGVSPRGTNATQNPTLFQNGELAYFVGGPWNLEPFNAQKGLDWGIAAFPTFAGSNKVVTPTGSWALSINSFSKEREAAAIFVKWAASQDGYMTYSVAPELPATSTGNEVYLKRPVFLTPEGQKASNLIAYELKNTAVNRVNTVGFIEFDNVMTKAYSDIANGGDVASILNNASDQIKTAWAVYKK